MWGFFVCVFCVCFFFVFWLFFLAGCLWFGWFCVVGFVRGVWGCCLSFFCIFVVFFFVVGWLVGSLVGVGVGFGHVGGVFLGSVLLMVGMFEGCGLWVRAVSVF